ncbi:hypothetical protein BK666_28300 [Pseudomonas frederiksbergensis]|uniref:Uncharacterized protein n=1 Tax=Pseudomonas frederiksbergensis TaxID=104087 RepID=A0A423JN92_9PSED|nr:hypothetical protein BK666_28300 [Pseudomonas frederiksbergensis]
MRKLQVTNKNIIAKLIIFSGLVGMVLSVFCIFSLAVTFVVVALITIVYAVDFNSVFIWFGLPLAVLMSLRWFYKSAGYVKLIING